MVPLAPSRANSFGPRGKKEWAGKSIVGWKKVWDLGDYLLASLWWGFEPGEWVATRGPRMMSGRRHDCGHPGPQLASGWCRGDSWRRGLPARSAAGFLPGTFSCQCPGLHPREGPLRRRLSPNTRQETLIRRCFSILLTTDGRPAAP